MKRESGKGKGKRIKDGMKNDEKKGVRRKSKRGRGEKGKWKGEREEDKGRNEEWGEERVSRLRREMDKRKGMEGKR